MASDIKKQSALWILIDKAGMLLVLAILVLVCSAFVPNFFSVVNFTNVGLMVTTIGIVSCTMLLCLASGDFDLSVGSILGFSGVIVATVMAKTGSVTAGVAVALALGALVGFANGFVVAKLGINALITTLATMQIVRGLAYITTNGNTVGVAEESFFKLGTGAWLGVPVPVWIMILCFVVFGFLLSRTTFGRNTLAIGGNSEAARLAGIPVVRTKIIIFTLQGLMSAFAGIIVASRMASGQPKVGEGLELQVISACVLGGVSLTGGIGSIWYVIAGVMIMGVVQNAMSLMNLPTFYQYVVWGSILLIAVLLDRLKQRHLGRR
jgi:L-arabinose transport system permease protein